MTRFTRIITGLTLLVSALLPFASISHALSTDISAEQFEQLNKEEIVLVDVRTPEEYNDGYIPGAINLPLAELPQIFTELENKDQKIVVYCRSGRRAGKAITFLNEQGFTNLVHLEGDFQAWSKDGREIAKP